MQLDASVVRMKKKQTDGTLTESQRCSHDRLEKEENPLHLR